MEILWRNESLRRGELPKIARPHVLTREYLQNMSPDIVIINNVKLSLLQIQSSKPLLHIQGQELQQVQDL